MIVIDSTYIIFLVRLDHLFDDSWWTSLMKRNLVSKQMTEEQRSIFIHAFDTFVDSSYITKLFVSVESTFRSFYSSTISNKIPFNFHKVYEDLLRKFNLDNYIELLRLASYIRNSFHNNGVHTLDDVDVVWRNVTYRFTKGKPIELGDVWHTFTVITTDILEMLEKLVKSDAILQKQEIIDISYDNLF